MESIQDRTQQQIAEISNQSDKMLISNIGRLRKEALPGLIPTLLDRWKRSKDSILRSELYQFFLDTKNQEELIYFMDAIENDSFKDVQSELISVLWQSSLDATDRLEDLVRIALKGDYMTIIEVGTVIENFETEFEEHLIMDLIYRIEEASGQEADEQRVNLLNSLRQIISELNLV